MPIRRQPLHPRSDELEDQAYAWAAARGLVPDGGARRLAASRVVTLATSYYRTAGYAEMAVLARWYVWLLTLDDWFDHAGRLPRGVPRPFHEALVRDLWPVTAEGAPGGWRNRFARHLRECVAGYRWQAGVRLGAVPVPDVAGYVAWRRRSFGAYPVFDLVEYVERQTFPVRLAEGRAARAAVAAASDVMAWTNDVHSLPRDIRAGETANLAVLVRARDGGGWPEALAEVDRMTTARVVDLLRARDELAEAGRQGRLLGARVTGAVRGAWDWHRDSARYREEEPVTVPPSSTGWTTAGWTTAGR
ncbi:terpene synthase family protein [Streptomyces avicenniae]|uniref:terpene synthase family protein n=1 Tax=Streptomyces avicenniae TaxID=500153 RepID=UPI00069C953E|nr:hypothetical protein [Streptomyces avicenniae]